VIDKGRAIGRLWWSVVREMGVGAKQTERDRRRRAILDVARAVFFEEGYSEASMSTIAARVGGSKATLYNYFQSKKELFDAQIREQCESHAAVVFDLPPDGQNVRRVLTDMGERFLDMLLSESGLQTFRLVTSEAPRDPSIGRIFYEAGPMTGARRLAVFLAQAERTGGLPRLGDPLQAAQQFVALLQGGLYKRRLLNMIDHPTREEVLAEVTAAVDTFMAAFGPRAD
jgi:AcrR family transcriptional regulator